VTTIETTVLWNNELTLINIEFIETTKLNEYRDTDLRGLGRCPKYSRSCELLIYALKGLIPQDELGDSAFQGRIQMRWAITYIELVKVNCLCVCMYGFIRKSSINRNTEAVSLHMITGPESDNKYM
jgi:hypothetical protein